MQTKQLQYEFAQKELQTEINRIERAKKRQEQINKELANEQARKLKEEASKK